MDFNNYQDFNNLYGKDFQNDYNSQNFGQNAQDVFNKYSGYSQSELMQEFLNQTAIQKQKGTLSPEKLDEIKDVLLPYLNNNQRETLEQILNRIK